MSKLTCKRCGATAEGKDFDECDDIIDHSVGLTISRPCSGDIDDLVFSGAVKKTVTAVTEPKSPTVKKTKK